MFQRKPRRFRGHQNGRDRLSHGNGYKHMRPRSNSFSNGQIRNNFRTTQSAEKLFEKYNVLAKEAMSTGDKTLGENYFQHADHFMRILGEQENNKPPKVSDNKIQNKISVLEDNNKDQNIKS